MRRIAVRYFWAFWVLARCKIPFWPGVPVIDVIIGMWTASRKIPTRSDEGWFAHMGWMLRNYKSGEVDLSNVADLQRDPVVMWQQRHYAKLVLISNVGVPVALGLLHGDVIGMFLLAGFSSTGHQSSRDVFINSLCHMWGRQPYTDTNTAKDNPLLALVTYGEGYHNFHHPDRLS